MVMTIITDITQSESCGQESKSLLITKPTPNTTIKDRIILETIIKILKGRELSKCRHTHGSVKKIIAYWKIEMEKSHQSRKMFQ
jgi:hypothetical protein